MAGKPLPRDSVEMIAMESYILELSRQYGAMSPARTAFIEPPAFTEPDRRAVPGGGKSSTRKNAKSATVKTGKD